MLRHVVGTLLRKHKKDAEKCLQRAVKQRRRTQEQIEYPNSSPACPAIRLPTHFFFQTNNLVEVSLFELLMENKT